MSDAGVRQDNEPEVKIDGSAVPSGVPLHTQCFRIHIEKIILVFFIIPDISRRFFKIR